MSHSPRACKPGDIVYIPTPLDNMHAMMYAHDKVLKEKISNPAVQKAFPGIKWRSDDEHRIYPCPPGLKCEHGIAVIGTKDLCLKLSQIPFDPITGKPWESVSCSKDSDCKNLPFEATCAQTKDGGSICQPKFPYLEWRADDKDPLGGKCVFGNSVYYKWCKFPEFRRTSSEAGVTDVPPFKYDPTTGKCSITKDYCHWMEVEFRHDSKGRPTCKESKFQKIMEQFFVGRTIFRDIKKFTEGFQPPVIAKMLVDRTQMKSYRKIGDDFAGKGVGLYSIDWGKGSKSLGFMSDEVRQIYPQLVINEGGLEYLSIQRHLTKADPMIKRMYLVCQLRDQLDLDKIAEVFGGN